MDFIRKQVDVLKKEVILKTNPNISTVKVMYVA